MKIVKAEAFPVRIPLKEPFAIALGVMTHSEQVFVRLEDETGRAGWGETSTFHAVYGYDQKSLYNVLTDHLLPAVVGLDPGDPAGLHRRLDQAVPFNLMAKCGVDLAAWDLAAQAAGLPLYGLLGGRRGDSVPVAATVDILSPAEAAGRAADLVGRGFQTIKVKIGADPADDLERVKAVRSAVGGGIRIRVDANQGYDRDAALRVLKRMESLDLEWIEQPLAAWDLAGHAALALALDTPIALDESVYTDHDAHLALGLGAADVINIKLVKGGGIHRAQKIAAVCAAAGAPCFLGGCIELTPGTLAAAHFYAATPSVVSAAEIIATKGYLDDVVDPPVRVEDGMIRLPEAVGLGVTVDPEKVERYTVQM